MFRAIRSRTLGLMVADHAALLITVLFGEQNPPAGVVIPDGGEEIRFAGWLGMLEAISDLYEDAADDRGTKQEVES